MNFAGVKVPLAFPYMMAIFNPLQGFYDLLIFMYPKVIATKRSRGAELSWCRAFANAFGSALVGGRLNNTRARDNNRRCVAMRAVGSGSIASGEEEQSGHASPASAGNENTHMELLLRFPATPIYMKA